MQRLRSDLRRSLPGSTHKDGNRLTKHKTPIGFPRTAIPVLNHSDSVMFCPLCQSEYRDGFSECAGCHVRLVNSRTEAKASSVQLWKGDRQSVLDNVLAALDAIGVPSHFHEIVNMGPQMTAFGIPLLPKKSTFEYEVRVFRSDLKKARAAITNLI